MNKISHKKEPLLLPGTNIDFSSLEIETIKQVIGGKLIVAKLTQEDIASCEQSAELCDDLAEHAIYVVMPDPEMDSFTTVCDDHLAMLYELHKNGKPLIFIN